MTIQHSDVIVVGGGPAGSTCAAHLRAAGATVRVIDAAVFPRDKVCAGWITPHVIRTLALDVEEYSRGRVFEDISSFRVGSVGDRRAVTVPFDRSVSAMIRRCEFDDYLLRRSGAEVEMGHPVRTVRREGGTWIVDDRWSAPVLIGAGGSQCPVSRMLNGPPGRLGPLVVARETEVPFIPGSATHSDVRSGHAEIYFTEDLLGYGWCLRKGTWVNIGLGRLGNRLSRGEIEAFAAFLRETRGVTAPPVERWRGHSYVAGAPAHFHRVDEGVLLVGDAAGLASDRSGEGIGPAVDSAIVAASFVCGAQGAADATSLARYDAQVTVQPSAAERVLRWVPATFLRPAVTRLLRHRPFVENVVLNRWFLHAGEAAVPAA